MKPPLAPPPDDEASSRNCAVEPVAFNSGLSPETLDYARPGEEATPLDLAPFWLFLGGFVVAGVFGCWILMQCYVNTHGSIFQDYFRYRVPPDLSEIMFCISLGVASIIGVVWIIRRRGPKKWFLLGALCAVAIVSMLGGICFGGK